MYCYTAHLWIHMQIWICHEIFHCNWFSRKNSNQRNWLESISNISNNMSHTLQSWKCWKNHFSIIWKNSHCLEVEELFVYLMYCSFYAFVKTFKQIFHKYEFSRDISKWNKFLETRVTYHTWLMWICDSWNVGKFLLRSTQCW